ncbi:MAG: M15 family metallopeptidase, partial [Clostridia bacterium]|nr:M15 family metallopeptidase [Clostridia bacterium]
PEPDPVPDPVPETAPPATGEIVGYTSKGFPIEVREGRTYIGGLLIVNKTYSLPSWYDPGGMTPECASAFYTMCSAAAAEGLSFYSISDYRSYSLQSWLYQTYVDRDGREAADTFSARPGHSEHQTGLAIDVNSTTQAFANTAEGQWLAAHCWEYGFIIRYPQGKEWSTGFIYEPWHVRFVGTWLSIPLRDSGLTLEEYLGIDSVYN